MNIKLKNFISNYKFLLAGLFLFFILILVIVIPSFSEKTTASIWDGTIATSFEDGDGSTNNPYVINDGSQLAYFFTLLNSTESSNYFNKNYILTNNINLNNLDFNFSTASGVFCGNFDGQGYSIYNFNISKCDNEATCELSIFGKLSEASLKNINLTGGKISSDIENSKLAVLAIDSNNSTFSNISINNFELNSETSNSIAAGLFINDNNSALVNINVNISSNIDNTRILINNYKDTSISNIMYNNNGILLIDELNDETFYSYTIVNNYIHFDLNYPIKSVLELINNNSEYTWIYSNDVLRLQNKGKNDVESVIFSSAQSTTFETHTSGIVGTTVYVNDIESDNNYYDGLNYTYSEEHSYPTSVNKNKYNESNLVNMMITYSGTNLDGSATGTVSSTSTENQNTFIYYKVYEVNNNDTPDDNTDDYVNLELIDNPFSYCVVNSVEKGFNGWTTLYSGAVISIDIDDYTRYAKIPVTYTSDKPDDITITFNAAWITAFTGTAVNGFSGAFDNFKTQQMTATEGSVAVYDCSNYYIYETISKGESYRSNAYDSSHRAITSSTCSPSGWFSRTCSYYYKSDSSYDSSLTYYTWSNNRYSKVTPTPVSYDTIDLTPSGTKLAGFFEKITVPKNSSLSGYYDASGNLKTSGTCTTSGGCTYYNLIQRYDQNNNETSNGTTVYYYIPTRDTNILHLGSNITTTSNSDLSNAAPFTFTGIGTSYKWTINGTNIIATSDIKIENMKIVAGTLTNTSSSISSNHTCSGDTLGSYGCGEGLEYNTDTNYVFVGNNYNIKFGRGITQDGTKLNFAMVMGSGTEDAGSSSSVEKFKIIVESGVYAALSTTTDYNKDRSESTGSLADLFVTFSNDLYLNATGIYGSDYDRVSNNNSNLIVGYSLAGSWGHNIYSASGTNSYKTFATHMTVKSGTYGFTYEDYTSGIYAGARGGFDYTGDYTGNNWKGAVMLAPHELTIEGGNIHNIMGGPSSKGDNKDYNDTYIYMKGGTANFVFGGTGKNDTYCNKIVQLTGGTINYSVFGGSNGSTDETTSSESLYSTGKESKILGDTYIYLGGNITVGTVTSTYSDYDNVEAGSVFGSSNGRSGYDIGAVDNVTIIIDGNATISNNVYGGANYGQSGIASSTATTTTIKILGTSTVKPTIGGNVYGGGNNNGLGSESYSDNSTITLTEGTVTGNIYGGSNISGTLYGNTVINVTGGQASKVFGGAAGSTESTETPEITGTITVNVSGGSIGDVFGGFDAKGTPVSTDTINITGGTIGNVYGGGNNTSNNDTHINMSAGTVTGTMYGGGNVGTVDGTTNIITTGGTISELYGGGKGSTATVSGNISSSITSTTITHNAYGGGENAASSANIETSFTNGSIGDSLYGGGKGSTATVSGDITLTTNGTVISGSVYGGGDAASSSKTLTTTLTGGSVGSNVFGGGKGSTATVSDNITLTTSGTIITGSVYGGGDAASSSKTVTTSLTNGTVGSNVFGGGKGSSATVSGAISLTINGTTVSDSVYGGGDAGLSSSNVTLDLTNATVKKQLFGGGKEANVNGNVDVDVSSCSIGSSLASNTSDCVFGGGNAGDVGGTSSTLTLTIDTTSVIKGNVFGGGNDGKTNGSITTDISDTTISGSFFGGGNGSAATVSGAISTTFSGNSTISGSAYGGGNAALSSSNVTFDATNTTIKNQFFGGGNQANVNGYVDSDFTTCNIGSSLASNTTDSVYGGGNSGNVELYINLTIDTTSVIKGTVYGGGNAGTTGGNLTTNIDSTSISGNYYGGGNGNTAIISGTISTTFNNVTVGGTFYGGGNNAASLNSITTNVTGGTITGKVHGGGNGSTASVTGAINTSFTDATLSSIFYGGGFSATSGGNITTTFTNSTTKDIYGGGDGSSATVSGNITTTLNNTTVTGTFYGGGNSAISQKTVVTSITGQSVSGIVYGGGNGTTATVMGAITLTVNNNTSRTIYGGGNAAKSSSSVKVDITSSTIKKYLYGGGQGANATVTGAIDLDVTGSVVGSEQDVSTQTSDYAIGTVFGGGDSAASNSTVNVTIDGNSRIIGTVFGGGNGTSATVSGNITLELLNNNNADEDNDTIDGFVFGGGNAANSNSNVTLNINNIKTITKSVYAGGNDGIVGGTITSTIDTATIDENYYGGGKGSAATVTGNIANTINNSTITGNVYGGGNAGLSSADISLNLSRDNITGDIFGGGDQANVNGGITLNLINVTGSGDLYGGGNAGESCINNGTSITIDSDKYTCTSSSDTNCGITVISGSFFGGGKGTTATVHGNITINLKNTNINTSAYGGGDAGLVEGTIDLTSNKLNVTGSLYGGGNQANVLGNITMYLVQTLVYGSSTNALYGGGRQGDVGTSANPVSINITTLGANTQLSNLYGGGDYGKVYGDITLNLNNGKVSNNIYGGGNNGVVTGSTTITNSGMNISGSLYGGGNNANVTGTTTITLTSGSINGYMFGGGNNGTVKSTNINMSSGTVYGAIYGGGDNAAVLQTSTIVFTNGVLGTESTETTPVYNTGKLYGGGRGSSATVHGIIDVTIKNGNIYGNVFGGGNAGLASSNINLLIEGGTIYGSSYGGGDNAAAQNNVYVTIKGGTIGVDLYGGGNNGYVSNNTIVNFYSGNVDQSVFGGGNGSSAIVYGDSTVYVGGTATIGTSSCTEKKDCSLYGGGKSANTGSISTNDAIVELHIAGGTIYGNVYGGGKQSKVFGQTSLNIGAGVITSSDLTKSNILIDGTVYGGSESYTVSSSSSSSSTSYSDDSTTTVDVFKSEKSVTKAILIEIDGTDYSSLIINGSIFGSGNYSSSGGTSIINISNYGTYENPRTNLSIQRTDTLTINNSAIVLMGAIDVTSTNEDKDYSLAHIEEFILKNNSTLFLNKVTSQVKEYKSKASDDTYAEVIIDDENETITKTSDNRIYVSDNTVVNFNTSDVTSYGTWGRTYGMTFFGLFSFDASDNVNTGIYDKYDYGDELDWGDTFLFSSYVRGLYVTNEDFETNGYYTNYIGEESNTNIPAYIIPEEAALTSEEIEVGRVTTYTWYIGTEVIPYDPITLTARMYSTLSSEVMLLGNDNLPNTTFDVIGFDTTDLDPSVSLVNKNDLPRIAETTDEADTVMSLAMESTGNGWLNSGTTYFISEGNTLSGTTRYIGDNTYTVPVFNFYIYHSKNMATSGDMGSVKIILRATTKISENRDTVKTVYLIINLNRIYELSDSYDAALTSGKKYSLFKSNTTSITSKSAISVYFSMYVNEQNIYKTGYHRALTSTYAFPENTKITMIDLSDNHNDYYYHVITASEAASAASEIETEGDAQYLLSTFEKMGAFGSGIYYDDVDGNSRYYHSDDNYSDEEFIFIIDFEDTNISSNQLDKKIEFELLDSAGETKKELYRDNVTIYSIYNDMEANIDLRGSVDKDTVYSGESLIVNLTSTYSEDTGDNGNVVDTQYEDDKIGIKLTLYNNSNEIVSGTSLLGLNYIIDGVSYSPNIDGTTRIKLSDKVGNVTKWIRVDTGTSNLATGNYKLVIENFASPDGIYYGLNTADQLELNIRIVNEIYGLNVTTNEKCMIVYANSGLNLANSRNLVYNVIYNSGLENPNIHVKMYRRSYDTMYDTNFEEVDLKDYVSNSLTATSVSNDYKIISSPSSTNNVTFNMKQDLISGTYKIQFILYDGDSAVGSVDKYIIIK